MCYSAQIWAEYRKYEKTYGAKLSIREFVEAFWEKKPGDMAKYIPKAFVDSFNAPQNEDEEAARARFEQMRQDAVTADLAEIETQTARLELNRAKLAAKPTLKGAANEVRIATSLIAKAQRRIDNVLRTETTAKDSRIWSGFYAPVMIWENGQRVVRPMRFGCRPARAPASYDRQYPGTFNARIDSLKDFWRGEFGYTHAVIMASQFYEAVDYYDYTHATRGEKDVDRSIELVFRPEMDHDMVIACLYSHWERPGEPDLWSFAFVTTDPPPEVAAAGHNRCIMPIKSEDIDRWLQPAPDDLKRFYEILEARERPYYNHAVVRGLDDAAEAA